MMSMIMHFGVKSAGAVALASVSAGASACPSAPAHAPALLTSHTPALTLGATDVSTEVTAVIIVLIIVGGLVGAFVLGNRQQWKRERMRFEHEKAAFDEHMAQEAITKRRSEAEGQMLATQLELAKIELAVRKGEEGAQGATPLDLNRLHAAKLKKESELLDVQLELARRDLAMRGDQLDYHDTMMERAKLEIESLKLRIREQQKDLDGFGQ